MTLQLKDMRLLRRKGYIDGKWVDADAGGSFAVTNPASGETIVHATPQARARSTTSAGVPLEKRRSRAFAWT